MDWFFTPVPLLIMCGIAYFIAIIYFAIQEHIKYRVASNEQRDQEEARRRFLRRVYRPRYLMGRQPKKTNWKEEGF